MNIRIFHISDFHLNKKNLKDWNDYLKESFIHFINENKAEENFIVCSGDMIDKGGADFGGVKAGLEIFRDSVINPIITKTGISVDRFIMTLGNHDIDRNADKDYTRRGVRDSIKEGCSEKIDEYVRDLLDNKGEPSKRVCAYYNFVSEFYAECKNVIINYLGAVFNYSINGENLAFTAFNTAWNCCDDNDKDWGLAIGEPQYLKCNQDTPDNAVRIAIMHHPLDWMLYEKRTIQNWIRNDYDLLLMGHVHETETMLTVNSSGNLIISFAPCFTNDIRKDSITYSNGFSVVDFDTNNRQIDFSYQKYAHKNRKYVLNHDYVESGHYHAEITEGVGDKLAQLMTRCMSHINTKYVPEINNSIIPQKAKAIGTLNEAFVMPPLKKNGDLDGENELSLASILNSPMNMVLFGQHESGKTVLLNKLLLEYVANETIFDVVPVFYDFEAQLGKDVETIIKSFLDCNSDEAGMLINAKKIVLLVDNYTPDEAKKEQAKKLYRFIADNSIRLIATSSHDVIDSIPDNFVINNEISCEYFFIHQFHSSNIKELITKWSPDIQLLERNQKIENLVNRFCSFSLPCTAMSVSLYLWSTENSNRDPVNPAILLDIYMEIVLERMSVQNVYVNTFDYENKASLLAYIAQSIHDEMQDNYSYTLSYGHYITKIEDYLKKVGFQHVDSERLAKYFIDRKVFLLKDGNVEFAHACFYYFFLAKRMIKDPVFRERIINKDEYYKYDRVIDYYSGLVRSDKGLLEFLYEEFEKVYSEVAFVYNDVDMDKCFTIIRKGQTGYTPLVKNVSPQKVIEKKPTEEEAEKKVLAIADEKLSQISDKFYKPQCIDPTTLILMLSRALRNLDGIEDTALKQKVYNSIIKNAMILTAIVKDQLALYANNHDGSLPTGFDEVKDVGVFFRFMPFNMQRTLGEILATRKLLIFFEGKYNKDVRENVSDVEKFMSIGMMWDSTGIGNKKHIKSFIKQMGNNSVQDYVLLKLLYYFDNKVAFGSEEEDQYIDLLADLKVKQKIVKPIEKSRIMKQMKETRNKMLAAKKEANK